MNTSISRQRTRISVGISGILATVLAIAGCSGGGAPNPNPNPGGGGPAAGTANISGTLQQGTGGKVTSAVGDGLSGILVQLIEIATGDVVGSDISDAAGNYEFKGIPAGKKYLLKLEFTSSTTLNAAGIPQRIELVLPLDPTNQQVLTLLQQLGVVDSDGDGQLDAIRFENELQDNRGLHRSRGSEHRFRNGETVIDDNGNGRFDDDTPFDDSDCDGLRDGNGSGGNSTDDIGEREVGGTISAISADSITVAGVTFTLTEATRFLDRNNNAASRATFTIGMLVEVEGIANGGGFIAFKVKVEDDLGGDDDFGEREVRGTIAAISETSITVAGVTFSLQSGTVFLDDNNNPATRGQFTTGTLIEVEGVVNGEGGLIATKVKLEDEFGGGGDDNGGNDDNDNSGSGGDGNDSGNDGGGDDGTGDQGSGDN